MELKFNVEEISDQGSSLQSAKVFGNYSMTRGDLRRHKARCQRIHSK
jgi:hypothetical protein